MAAALLLAAGPLRAQVVSGRVTALSSGEAIRGAWVLLLDSARAERAAALTDSAGRFVLRAPVTGRFRVVARQLGHEDGYSQDFDLVAGRTEQVELTLRERALPLRAITIEAERRCDTPQAEGTAAAVLWEEARKALNAVRWTGRAALLTYRIRQFERRLDLTGRLLTESETEAVSRGERPFTTPPPEQLAAQGYVQPLDDSFVFFAPDAEVLLSDAFANTHCFRPRLGRDGNRGLVGLGFEPVPGRRVPEVTGTLWIDSASAALRFIEFRYTGIDYGPRTNDLGGRLDFVQLPSGAWATERWRIRGPVTAPRRRDLPPSRALPPLLGFKETGAALVAILAETRVSLSRAASDSPSPNAPVQGVDFSRALGALRNATTRALADLGDESHARAALEHASDGILALERYAVTRRRAEYGAALAAFVRSARLDRGLALAHLGEGISHAHGPELELAGATGYQHRRVYAKTNAELYARRALLRAVQLAPWLEEAALELTALALATRDDSTLAVADQAVTLARAHDAQSGQLLVAASDVAAARGDLERAESFARSAVAVAPTGVAWHALGSALVRRPGHENEGGVAYLRGLEMSDGAALLRYFDDARLIFRMQDDSAWQVLARAEPAGRAAWLRQFWERTAAENAVTPGERLRTHLERIAHAHIAFRRQNLRGARPADALWVDTTATDHPFDARGAIYIRHGAPDEKISSPPAPNSTVGPNETWVYHRASPAMVFHFMKLQSSSDWQLTGAPPCDPLYYLTGEPAGRVLGESASGLTQIGGTRDYMRPYMNWFEARLRVDPGLHGRALECVRSADAIAAGLQSGRGKDIALAMSRLAEQRRRDLTQNADLAVRASRALATEQAGPVFTRPLDVITGLYTFRGQRGLTDVVTTVLVPVDGFTESASAEGVLYGVRLSVILMDDAQRVSRRDTVIDYSSAEALPRGRFFRSFLDIPALVPDSVGVRIAVRNVRVPGEGRLSTGRGELRNYSGTQLMLSDMVVAEAGPGRWTRGDVTISPIPSHQVVSGAAFQLFYEIYNVAENDVYETRIQADAARGGLLGRLGGLFGGRGNRIDVRFRDVARPSGVNGIQELRTIVAALEPGRYTMRVTVRNTRTGEQAASEIALIVNEAQG